MSESLVDRIIRRQTWLEKVGDALQGAVGAVYRVLGRPGQALKNVLHGTVLLGHPLHPAVSDLPIGAWAAGVVADFVAHFTTALPTQAGDVALAVGLAGALLAAVSGLTDYHETFGHERRVATVHGLTMVAVVTLEAASLGLRWWASRSLHPLAVALSTVGFAGVVAGGYLGGHLVFGIGTMVNRNAFAAGPEEYVPVGFATDFGEGELHRVQAADMPVLVVRRAGALHAIAATCSHAGGPLDEGTLDGDRVTCPWHGSVFSVQSGRCMRGPATFDQPAFDIREREGRVEVKLATPAH